jgi:hypothetical protein
LKKSGSEIETGIHRSWFKEGPIDEKEKPDRDCKRDYLQRKKGDG